MGGGSSEQPIVQVSPKAGSSWGKRLAASNCALVSMVVHLAVLILLGLMVRGQRAPEQVLAITAAQFETEDSPLELHGAVELAAGELARDDEDIAGELAATVEHDPTVAGEDPIRVAERTDDDFSAGLDLKGDLTAKGQGGGAARGDLGVVEAAFVERLSRANAKSGDVQISLMWGNYNDIDLHVLCPSGEHIYFGHRTSRCGGELDVDMNVPPRESARPVENVYWSAGAAPPGEYIVIVDHYRNHRQADPTEFDVRIEVDGVAKYFHNRISYRNKPIVVHRFRRE
jgi:hypothetical protein